MEQKESIEALINRYETIVEHLETELEEEKERVENLERLLDGTQHGWSRRREEDDSDLELPRLQIKHSVIDEYQQRWFYSLVYKHLTGDLISVPMGETIVRGAASVAIPDKDMTLDQVLSWLPFRDGAHIRHDAKMLDMSAYALINDNVYKLPPEERDR